MKIDEIIAALGGGAVLGWIGKWLISREQRLESEAKAAAAVERQRVKTTGETDVAALRAEHDTGRHLIVMAQTAQDRWERSQLGHMEALARLENETATREHLEREVAFRDEVIDSQSLLLQRAHDTIEMLTESLESSQRAISGAHDVLRDITESIARTVRSEPPPAPAE